MKRLACALAGAALAAAAHAQTQWDLPTGYAAASFQTENMQQFAAEVAQASGGKLKIVLHPNGSLYKANEIKRAMQSGRTRAGEFILSVAANENPLSGVDSIPFLADRYPAAKRLAEASRPAIDKLLASQGMKLLFVSLWPGHSLYSSKPVETLADLGQALASGTVENFLTSSASGVEMKLHESVKHFYGVNAWLPKNAVVVNRKAFDALCKPTSAAEARGCATGERKNDEYLKELGARGMKVAAPSEPLARELRKIGATMTAKWLKQAGPDGQAIIDTCSK